MRFRSALLASLVCLVGLALAASSAFADGGKTIAGDPVAVLGQQEFGNTVNTPIANFNGNLLTLDAVAKGLAAAIGSPATASGTTVTVKTAVGAALPAITQVHVNGTPGSVVAVRPELTLKSQVPSLSMVAVVIVPVE